MRELLKFTIPKKEMQRMGKLVAVCIESIPSADVVYK
jgi:hypothetical protein